MQVKPQKEHAWLQRFVGNWTYEIDAITKPGEPPVKLTGTETVRSIGGIWIVAEGQGEMPDSGTATSILTLGFDPGLKRYVGSWIGSMMTFLWIYEGTLDPAEKVLTLACEGPDFATEGKTTSYRDVHTWISENERTLTGNILGKDGQWSEMMTCRYRRAR